MLKISNKPLLLALIALAATFAGSAAAADNGQKQTPTVKTGSVTVTNKGYGPLTLTADPSVTKISGNGSFAIVTPGAGVPCAKGVVVPPRGGECTIGVQYTPTGAGGASARVTLTDSGAKNPTQDTIIRID